VADEATSYSLKVNGKDLPVDSAWIGESLLFVLRERLGLPGSKSACEQGECGACLIRFDGEVACSCCVLAADAQGADIRTVEDAKALGAEDVQAALVAQGGVQCGFCIPGFVLAIDDLLRKHPDPSTNDIKESLSGNLCRCTGYGRIVAAVQTVAQQRRDRLDVAIGGDGD
jgi:carbon-monoxide dehydrogenase small subunit